MREPIDPFAGLPRNFDAIYRDQWGPQPAPYANLRTLICAYPESALRDHILGRVTHMAGMLEDLWCFLDDQAKHAGRDDGEFRMWIEKFLGYRPECTKEM